MINARFESFWFSTFPLPNFLCRLIHHNTWYINHNPIHQFYYESSGILKPFSPHGNKIKTPLWVKIQNDFTGNTRLMDVFSKVKYSSRDFNVKWFSGHEAFNIQWCTEPDPEPACWSGNTFGFGCSCIWTSI